MTICTHDPIPDNARKLAAAILRWGEERSRSPSEVLELALTDLLGHPWIDDELREQLTHDLAVFFGLDVERGDQ